MSGRQFICIAPVDFDPSRVVIDIPMETKTRVPYTRARIGYLDNEGNRKELCIEAPPQYCFGVSPQYDFHDKDKTGEIRNYQVMYSLNSLKTFQSPTADEAAFREAISSIRTLLVEKLSDSEFFDNIPEGSQSFLDPSAPKNHGGLAGVKPLFEFPTKKVDDAKQGQKSVPDTSKPERMYVKLLYSSGTTKDGSPFTHMDSRFYLSSDPNNPRDPREFVDTRGEIRPLFHIKEVYFGTHGPKSRYGASISIRLLEADFKPAESAFPKGRMLSTPATTAWRAPADATEYGGEDDGGGAVAEDFTDDLAVPAKPAKKASAPPAAAGAGGPAEEGEVVKPKKKKALNNKLTVA